MKTTPSIVLSLVILSLNGAVGAQSAPASITSTGPKKTAATQTIVVPNAVAYVVGARDSLWGVEVRVTNTDSSPRVFAVVDWIGTPGWQPSSYTVSAGETLSLGGWDLYNSDTRVGGRQAVFGTAVCTIEDGFRVQTAQLSATYLEPTVFLSDSESCASFDGGYQFLDGGYPCNEGAGPVLDNLRDFFPAGAILELSWLHTAPSRRTNIALTNPDAEDATVTLTVTGASPAAVVTMDLTVPARSIIQLNDVFASEPFNFVRFLNEVLSRASARLRVHGSTRLFAIGYVISNLNNTVTISFPH